MSSARLFRPLSGCSNAQLQIRMLCRQFLDPVGVLPGKRRYPVDVVGKILEEGPLRVDPGSAHEHVAEFGEDERGDHECAGLRTQQVPYRATT
jgi:hypothetical protein